MARKVVFPVFLLICSFFATNARGAEAPVKTLAPYFWVASEDYRARSVTRDASW